MNGDVAYVALSAAAGAAALGAVVHWAGDRNGAVAAIEVIVLLAAIGGRVAIRRRGVVRPPIRAAAAAVALVAAGLVATAYGTMTPMPATLAVAEFMPATDANRVFAAFVAGVLVVTGALYQWIWIAARYYRHYYGDDDGQAAPPHEVALIRGGAATTVIIAQWIVPAWSAALVAQQFAIAFGSLLIAATIGFVVSIVRRRPRPVAALGRPRRGDG